jgi:hypothetical protein
VLEQALEQLCNQLEHPGRKVYNCYYSEKYIKKNSSWLTLTPVDDFLALSANMVWRIDSGTSAFDKL